MSDLRMPKGWTLVGTSDMAYGNTETREDKLKRDHRLQNAIRNTASLSEEDMIKESSQLAKEKRAEEDHLVQAYQDKKLTNKDLIKEARKILKSRKKRVDKKNSASLS